MSFRPAIVIAAYSRPDSLARLLSMVLAAEYPDGVSVPLVISIDGGGAHEVVRLADEFKWPFGDKEVIIHPENLGLREHILSCGDLTGKYGSIIMLEDDLGVSSPFYNYTVASLNEYKSEAKVAGVSLYNQPFCTSCWRPFSPLMDGFSNYFLQYASSWGQAWTARQWLAFRSWYNSGQVVNRSDAIPSFVSGWPESSWLKYFIKYMVVEDLYFVYPRASYSTNFSETGTHISSRSSTFQVPLSLSEKANFSKFDESDSVYDSFFEILPTVLRSKNRDLVDLDFEVDLYGSKCRQGLIPGSSYVLTSIPSDRALFSYGCDLRPHEMNVLANNRGASLFLAKADTLQASNMRSRIDIFKYDYAVFSRKEQMLNLLGTYILK